MKFNNYNRHNRLELTQIITGYILKNQGVFVPIPDFFTINSQILQRCRAVQTEADVIHQRFTRRWPADKPPIGG
jgi:hypothetical protein